MSSRYYLVLVAVVCLAAMGCSSGSAPMSPSLGLSAERPVAAATVNSILPWGMWEVTLDPSTSSATIIPLRALEFTANVTQFMQPPASKKNLLGVAINSGLTDWATGHVVVDVSFTHPFPGLDTYTGFDVRGVCMGDGSTQGVADPAIFYAGANELRVLNADGMTRWFNSTEFTTYGTLFGFTFGKLGAQGMWFTGTLNGYKYFCDGLTKDADVGGFFANPSCTNPRGLFSAGNTITRTYDLQFGLSGGAPKYAFQYAVAASWAPPMIQPPTKVPDDFGTSANCQEAYVLTTMDRGDLYYASPTQIGGSLALDVTAYDHQGVQHSAGVSDEITRIRLESQGGFIETNLATFEGAALNSAMIESNAKYARYHLMVPEAKMHLSASGTMPILVAVESANPATYDSGNPGFAFPPGALASYAMGSVNISSLDANKPPVAVASVVGGKTSCFAGQSLSFDGSASYDPDGTIASYAWDSDDDGVYDDATGAKPTIKFPAGGVFPASGCGTWRHCRLRG